MSEFTPQFLMLKANVTKIVRRHLAQWTAGYKFLCSADLAVLALKELNATVSKEELIAVRKQINSGLIISSKQLSDRVAVSMIKVLPLYADDDKTIVNRKGTGFCYIPQGKMFEVRAANINIVKNCGQQSPCVPH